MRSVIRGIDIRHINNSNGTQSSSGATIPRLFRLLDDAPVYATAIAAFYLVGLDPRHPSIGALNESLYNRNYCGTHKYILPCRAGHVRAGPGAYLSQLCG